MEQACSRIRRKDRSRRSSTLIKHIRSYLKPLSTPSIAPSRRNPLKGVFAHVGFYRFYYGNYTPPGLQNRTAGEKPYVQFLSVTEPDEAWVGFNDYYAQRLAQSPETIDSVSLITFIEDATGQAEDYGSSHSSNSIAGETAGDLAVSGAVAESDGGKHSDSYGFLAAVLSAASLIVGLISLSVTLYICLRGV
ncbi:hypothetical protein GY45DRAFT_1005148 [Cubamyces sp. BRFM 1775]|nr:hypothetical protein GY45DRAFT_1005148 [Cubamyces sp. BRFM 1775]